ncbi:MAG: insulinase family protein [Bacteroidetes bacterium]|nr:insulinase family protein [Bacteroidota bacterium]
MMQNHKIYFEQDSRIPITSFNLVFVGGGEQQEKEELAGLSRMTAKLLFRGTTMLSRETIQKKFDLLGAEVTTAVTETDFTVSVRSLTKNIQEVFSLLTHCFAAPAFPEEELTIAKQQQKASLLSSLQDSETVLRTGHRYVLFNGKRFGKLGSLSALERISRNEILLHYEKIINASVCYCSGISDLPLEEFEKLIAPFFKQRQTNGYSLLPEAEYKNISVCEAHIIHLENATNDRLMWSHQGLSALDSRRFALSLIVDALGSFEGYLFDELRNKKGWCYGAYATVLPGTTRLGRVIYYSDPSNESSQYLYPALLEHIQNFQHEKNFISRLQERPSTFKNRFAYQLDRKYKLTSRINFDRYGIPILSKEEYVQEIDSITPSLFSETIQALFQPKKLVMVFYGDSGRIQTILKGIEPNLHLSIYDKQVIIE